MPARSLSELESLSRDPSWVPAKKELATLLPGLAGTEAEAVERALFRAGPAVLTLALAELAAAAPALRVGLCRLVGRFPADPAAKAALLGRLRDEDARTRRAAARGLGKCGDAGVESALLAALDVAVDDAERKVLVEALGKVGGAAARARLATLQAGKSDKVLAAKLADAEARLLREDVRADLSTIRADLPFAPRRLRFTVRRGLERILAEELHAMGLEKIELAEEAVIATSSGPLEKLFGARIALHFGFVVPLPRGATREARVIEALAAPDVAALLTSLTSGPVRYRLDWPGGHQRAATRAVVEAVRARAPALVNDPRSTAWEVVVRNEELEIWPRGLVDPRFAYRVADVPASSHPTIAAALCRVAGPRGDDVVWDPFVGAGAELVERARLGPYAELVGTDTDPRAIEAARKNLANLSVHLSVGDARTFRPTHPVTLIVTNPPMGRRIKEKDGITRLLSDALAHFREVLAPGGRVVWLCPLFGDGAKMARAFGFSVERRGPVDLGGFSAELQVLT
ncbi:MAG: HEAT repeat domain-containing protein [Myxococcales bacterium]|nr:HEAT repeat domain-containing protein [Myxococcales bacterium]